MFNGFIINVQGFMVPSFVGLRTLRTRAFADLHSRWTPGKVKVRKSRNSHIQDFGLDGSSGCFGSRFSKKQKQQTFDVHE